MKIYLVHGFNVKDAQRASLAFLEPILTEAGHDVSIVDYGWIHRVRVRLCNSRLAKMLGSMAEKGSIAIGHSNGCDLIYRAAQDGAPFSQVILFNPALDSDTQFPKHIEKISVFYSPSDTATWFAQWIPWSNWGSEGNKGYTGPEDSRVVQYNEEEITKKEMGHSDISKYPTLFGQIVKQICSG